MTQSNDLVWREFPFQGKMMFRAQEWTDGTSPTMNGQTYTVIPNGRFSMETYACVYVSDSASRELGTFHSERSAKRAAQCDFDAYVAARDEAAGCVG
ncbi:hypothetical protein [Epibacterium ulvae]|uniref:hypothetical protein n=1 Tax=Epibacterium ulvae TaxID=1156985 RepID=UPI002491061F|nr:hypothetical protein [Epibacterium ulvae]